MVNMMQKGNCAFGEGKLLLNKKSIVDILESVKQKPWFTQSPKTEFSGKGFNVFVGRFNYPNVNVGVLFSEADKATSGMLDNPSQWSGQNLQIPTLALLRSSLINSGAQAHVKISSLHDRISERLKYSTEEIALSKKPLDVDVKVEKPVQFKMNFSGEATPHGPRAKIEDVHVNENPSVPKAVERLHSDTDAKASTAMHELSERGLDEHYLTKLMTAGQLGTMVQRKLVPTRWAITATDDILGKKAIAGLQHSHPESLSYGCWQGGYLGNNYFIMSFPGPFRYELFETHVPTGNCSTDFEDVGGRRDYADSTAGGYYAARLSIVEHLKRINRQASFLVLRFVSDEYFMPLGVWVVREAVRNAMRTEFSESEGMQQLLDTVALQVRQRFGLDATGIYGHSKLLKILRTQKTLASYA